MERVVKRYPVKGTSRFGVPGPITGPEGGAIYDCRTTSEAIQASFRLLRLHQTPGKHSVYEVTGKPDALHECIYRCKTRMQITISCRFEELKASLM
jgi:hypothetical protein